MKNSKKIKKIVMLAVLTAIAIVVNLIESMIPLIPGTAFKIGLANVIILVVMFGYGPIEGLSVGLARIFLSFLLAPPNATFLLSITGGLVSLLVMLVFRLINKFSIIPVSIVGSIMHVTGQLIAARFIDQTLAAAVTYYAPIMLGLSIPAGVITGILATRFLKFGQNYFDATKIIKKEKQEIKEEE